MRDDAALKLLTPEGRDIVHAAMEHAGDALSRGTMLRKRFPGADPAVLSAAAELVELRVRARVKFSRAGDMFFTRDALEQATGDDVAAHRAERFSGFAAVCDACCGIGGDAIALGHVAGRVICVDLDPARVAFCRENLRVHGIDAECIAGDITVMTGRVRDAGALFIDPSRRPGGTRTRDVHAMEPPIEAVASLMGLVPHGAVKLPPSARELDMPFPHEMEWVSTADGLKEAVAWTGDLRRCGVSVTLLHRGACLRDTDLPGGEAPVGEPGPCLFEPDPALIRSGLLGRAAAAHGMWRIDGNIAYMSADTPVDSPFFSAYRVIRSMAFSLGRLGKELSAMGIGNVTVKKRGFPMLPEEVRRGLKLTGSGHATVILTRIADRHRAFIVEPVT